MSKTIPWASPKIWGNEKKYVNEALDTLWISGGFFVSELETKFSELFKKPYVLTTSNGTTSIHLSYLALGLKPGDEIIIPGFGFLAAANIALQMGLKPIFVDVHPETWCVTAESIIPKLTKQTKVIVPIHTYGNVCEMKKIMEVAKDHNIQVIEDCAESLFSKIDGKYSGTFGDINSFSFQATKTITTGEGGIVVTENPELYRVMTLLRSHGLPIRGKYWHEVPGHNFRLTNLQAALGVGQFEAKEIIIESRKQIFSKYLKLLNQIDGLTTQRFEDNVEPVVWAIGIKIDSKVFGKTRDEIAEILKSKGIETRPGFVASSFLQIYQPHSLPISEDLSENILLLPSSPTLSDEDIEYICTQLESLKK